jgi:filamentous hemagglutinin family protein
MKYFTSYFALFLCPFASDVWAHPSGFQLVQGEATPPVLEGNTQCITTGPQAVIHWKEFSIDQGETTRFLMPSSKSSVLNRVIGSSLSKIYGTLEANGQIMLINSKGILVGKDANIITAGFLASTLDLPDDDFLRNGDLLFSGDSKAELSNLGHISARDGDVILLGYKVKQEGTIDAPHGSALLASGTHILIRPLENERILIHRAPLDESGEGGIVSTGVIRAIAAELQANGNPYHYAIKESGKIDAMGVEKRDGHIFLVAKQGTVSASGTYTAQKEMHILGDSVRVEEGATLNVSGETDGGTILIGGDYRGKNPAIPNAKVTYVAPHAHLIADATHLGNGGKVIVWADKRTSFYGSISAEGGPTGGDGGFVEVSCPKTFVFQGLVNCQAPLGKTGTVLLDPCEVTISSAGDAGQTFTCSTGYDFTGFDTSNIYTGTLETNLNNCSVIIDASGGNGATSSITLTDPVTWTVSNSLTLLADTIALNNLLNVPDGGAVIITGGDVTIGQTALGNAAGIQGPSGLGTSATVDIQSASLAINGGVGFSAFIAAGADSALGVTISASGPLSLQGGTLISNASQQAFIDCGTGFTTINTSGTLSIFSGNSSTAAFGNDAYLNNGPIQINTSASVLLGNINVCGGQSYIQAPTNISIETPLSLTNGLTMQGGDVFPSTAFIMTTGVNEDINIVGGSVNLLGGTVTTSSAYIQSSGNITITSGAVLLNAGQGDSSFVQILSGGTTSIQSNAASLILHASSADGAFAQISGSGEILLNVQGLQLAAGEAQAEIFNTVTGGITITQVGPVDPSGGVSLAGGTGTVSYARIESMGAVDILITGTNNPVFLTAGSSSAANGSNAFITAQGPITCTIAGNIELHGGATPFQSSFIRTTLNTSDINLSCNSCILQNNATISNAPVYIESAGNVAITTLNALDLSTEGVTGADVNVTSNGTTTLNGPSIRLANNGNGTFVQISGPNQILIDQLGSLLIEGGAIFTSGAGDIIIRGTATTSPFQISLNGESGPTSYATIYTTDGNIFAAADLFVIQGGTGDSAYASISSSGNITLTVSGDSSQLSLRGGSSTLSGGSNAFISATGSIILIGASTSLSIQGGDSPNQSAFIATTGPTESIDLVFSQLSVSGQEGAAFIQSTGSISILASALSLSGGESPGAYARIQAPGTITIDCPPSEFSVCSLSPGAAPAEIFTTGGGSIFIGQNDPPLAIVCTAFQPSLYSGIYTLAGGDIAISIGPGIPMMPPYTNSLLLGSFTFMSMSFPAQAFIATEAGGDISLTAEGDVLIGGGDGGQNASITATLGTITIACNNLTMTGGTNNSPAAITTNDGDIVITGQGSYSASASSMNSPVQIQTSGSDLSLTFTGSVTLGGFTSITTPAPTGNLLIIAGQNMRISGNATVSALGTIMSSLTLVCDNDFPTSPGVGSGQFNLATPAILSAGAGTPVRIFTATRSQNTISANINGSPFIPGPSGVDSPTEQYLTYYPSTFGGAPFTLFYKTAQGGPNPPPSPSPSLPGFFSNLFGRETMAFLSSQAFFDLGAWDRFAYFDWFTWSDFTTEFRDRKGRHLKKQGHSLRKRSGEFIKNIPLRGEPL